MFSFDESVMKKRLTFVLLAACFLSVDAFGQVKPEIMREEARSLLKLALKLHGFNVSSAHFEVEDINDPDFPDYHSFVAYDWDYPELQNVVGWYLVDRRTGEVWNWILCERYEYPKLVRLRAKMLGASAGPKAAKVKRAARPCLPEVATKIIRTPRRQQKK